MKLIIIIHIFLCFRWIWKNHLNLQNLDWIKDNSILFCLCLVLRNINLFWRIWLLLMLMGGISILRLRMKRKIKRGCLLISLSDLYNLINYYLYLGTILCLVHNIPCRIQILTHIYDSLNNWRSIIILLP